MRDIVNVAGLRRHAEFVRLVHEWVKKNIGGSMAENEGYRAVGFALGDELEKALARIRELEAQLAEAKKEAESAWEKAIDATLGGVSKCEKSGGHSPEMSFGEFIARGGNNCAICLTAKAARLEAALKEYANATNWQVSDSSSGYLDKWLNDDGPTVALAALAPEPAATWKPGDKWEAAEDMVRAINEHADKH